MAYELSDKEWTRLKEWLPERKGKPGRPCLDLRRTMNGIKWVLKTGSPWRALPEQFGNWNSVFRYFCRLQQKGIFEKIFAELTKGADLEEISLDSTFVKVHRHGLGAKKGFRFPTKT